MSTRDQDQQIRQLLAELEMLSYGTTQSFNSTGGTDSERDTRPRGGDTRPLHDTYRDAYNAVTGEHDRGKVIAQATDALRDMKRRTAPPVVEETDQQMDVRIRVKLSDGWTVTEVALACRCTPTRVRRAAAGAPAPITVEERDRDTQIRALAAQDLSVRNIAMRLKVAKSTVHDVLRKAA